MAVPPDRQFLERLRQRKIVQWTVAYLSAAWLTLQVVDILGKQFGWSVGLQQSVTALLGAGLVATLILAWYHGEKGAQRVRGLELALLAALFAGAALVVAYIQRGELAAARPLVIEGLVLDPLAIAVTPFVPATADTALSRLGLDLVITVSATLDGVGELRTVDALTMLAQANTSALPLPLADARALAHRLGAGRVLHGGLAHAGERVRLDAALYDVAASRPLARVSVIGEAHDVGALTDSLTLGLVRALGQAHAPDLATTAALRTGSVSALRAYLEGEHALARGDFEHAVHAYDRAFTADSTFWFAYWRSLYPRVYEGSGRDSAVYARIVANAHTLPDRDRVLIEAALEPSLVQQRRILEDATRRFPTYWPVWYEYANLLVHWTPYLGTGYADARLALERVVALNPAFAPAWEHLFWTLVSQRDAPAAEAALARIEAFVAPGSRWFSRELIDHHYAALVQLIRADDAYAVAQVRADAAAMAGAAPPYPPAEIGATVLLSYGLPRGQLALSKELLPLASSTRAAAAQWMGMMWAWAGRGAWDSAAVAAAQWVRLSENPRAPLVAYGLFTAGTALGLVSAADALQHRPDAAPAAATGAPAELAWLDGVLAAVRGDAAALARARTALSGGGSPFTAQLDASLAAFELHAHGDARAAAAALRDLEHDIAERRLFARFAVLHPFMPTVHRVVAARALAAVGENVDAARLLAWHEAVLPGVPPMELANKMVGAVALVDRGQLAEALGRGDEAAAHYTEFLRRYDLPTAAALPLVVSARRELQRLDAAQHR
jgi:TolB-like protein